MRYSSGHPHGHRQLLNQRLNLQPEPFSLFIDPLVTDVGISRSAISLLYGLATLGAALLLPVTGRLVDRYGTRIMMVFATFGFGMACITMSQVTGAVTLLAALPT